MSSRRTSFLGACGGLSIALGTAVADEVCLTVGATVSELRPNASEILAVPSLDSGTPVTVELGYDSATPGTPEGEGVAFQIPDLRLRLVIDGVSSTPGDDPAGQAFLIDSPVEMGQDSLTFSGRVQFSGATVLVSLQLEDLFGIAFGEAVLPESLEVSFFTRANLMTKTLPGDSRSLLFNAAVDVIDPCRPPTEAPFRRAETDGDGTLTLSDAVRTLLFLFRGEEEPSCMDAADSNDDGVVDLSDGVRTLLYLFNGGSPPPAPTSCGADPTTDGLGCKAFEPCA
jgi:hypothetical protein